MTKEQVIFWLLFLRFNPDNNVLPNEVIDIAIGAIVAQPERQRGAWIEYIPEHGKCPFCGNQVDLLGGKANNFCGECGADMRGKQE